MRRIIIHWSAGGYTPSALDKKHYHFIVAGDGTIAHGDKKPEANLDTSDGNYAAHTRGTNTGAIGVAFAAMRGAVESPFDHGPDPITPAQVAAMADLCADLCEAYGIPVSRETVLTHSEVQPTLGIKQRGKWDVNWLPGMTKPGRPVTVGDALRALIRDQMYDDVSLDSPSDPVPVMHVDEGRRSPSSSTTLRAQVMQWVSTFGAGGYAMWNTADDQTRYIIAGLVALAFVAGWWVFKERLRKWANGDR